MHLLNTRIFKSCITFKIHSLFAVVYTHNTPIVTAIVIAWHFKAQSKNILSNTQKY